MNTKPIIRAFVLFVSVVVLGSGAPGQVAPGLRLYGPFNGTDTHLVDTNGAIVQTWPSAYLPGASVYLQGDGTLIRSVLLPGAPAIPGEGGGVQRVGLDGALLWEYHYAGPLFWSHHDIEPMPNGNVLLIAWQNKTVAQAVAAGRAPSLIQGNVMRPDSIIEVQPTGPTSGTIVWEWHVWDHLVQELDPTKANYGSVAAHPELVDVNYPPVASQAFDWNHMNSVKYDPVHDRIMMSARAQNEIWVIDHSTTTAEAAGHTGGAWGKGGDILYRYGNPECYQAGGPADRVFFGQHCARFIPPGYPGAGNFTVFNNNPPNASSTVWEFIPPMDATGNFILTPGTAYGPSAPIWTYSDPQINSMFMGSAERLINGNTLICNSIQGSIIEVTPAGQAVWFYSQGAGGNFIFQSHYVERTLWSDLGTVSASIGDVVTFDAILGTTHAGKGYGLLASAAGTTPGVQVSASINIPLNFDSLMIFSFENANSPVLDQSFGVLDSHGRAKAFLNLPPNVSGPANVNFACVIVNLTPLAFLTATNPVPLTIVP